MEDDYQRLTAVWERHKREIASYQGWKALLATQRSLAKIRGILARRAAARPKLLAANNQV